MIDNAARSVKAEPVPNAERALSERRKLGAFYTPERLSQIMADWAIRSADDKILEPSFGGCGFLAAARDSLLCAGASSPSHNIYGCDVDPVAFGYLASVLGSPTDTTGFLLRDFLECANPPQWPAKFSVVLANPPYIPHHRIGCDRVRELSRREQGIPGTGGRSSLWAYFISHSVSMLAYGGRMAWVLPGAFLQADYGAPIRAFLAGRFEKVAALIIRERLFLSEGTDEETVILLAEGYREQAAEGAIEIGEAQTLDELEGLIVAWSKGEWSGRTGSVSPAMLSMSGGANRAFASLADSPECRSLGTLAKIRIGLVTGANDFFVLSRSQVKEAGLEPSDCLSVLPKFRACRGIRFDEADLDGYLAEGARALLISKPGGPISLRVDAYLASFGEDRKSQVSTFRKRPIWSQTSDGQLPDAFFPVMHHTGPRIVMNELGCHCTNTLHRVFFDAAVSTATRQLACVSMLSTFSQISAELIGRRYGSGVLKHEPRDAERILLLVPSIGDDEIAYLFGRVDQLLRSDGADAARRFVDTTILRHMGVSGSGEVAAELDTALVSMRERRRPKRA